MRIFIIVYLGIGLIITLIAIANQIWDCIIIDWEKLGRLIITTIVGILFMPLVIFVSCIIWVGDLIASALKKAMRSTWLP